MDPCGVIVDLILKLLHHRLAKTEAIIQIDSLLIDLHLQICTPYGFKTYCCSTYKVEGAKSQAGILLVITTSTHNPCFLSGPTFSTLQHCTSLHEQSVNHTSMKIVRHRCHMMSSTVQDMFQPILGLVSCARVTRRWSVIAQACNHYHTMNMGPSLTLLR